MVRRTSKQSTDQDQYKVVLILKGICFYAGTVLTLLLGAWTFTEAVVDRVSLDRHHLSKRAKDIGSAAVFLALLNVVVVWGLVLLG